METRSWVFRIAFAASIFLPISLGAGDGPGGKSAKQPTSGYDFVSAYRRIRDEMAKHAYRWRCGS